MKKLVLLIICLLSLAQAQIGQPVESLELAMDAYKPLKTVMGYFAGKDFRFELEERGGVLYKVSGKGPLDETNIPLASDLIGYATGYGESMAGPVKTFFEERIAELAGQGATPLGVEQYILTVDVSGEEAPYTLDFSLELSEVDTALFPQGTHTLGPDDAKHVIREFSDFQCPYCARFVNTAYEGIKEELLARGDVRFEFHHFPLISIHPNAFPAAEATECVVAANTPEAFWLYHDSLFARQQAWQGLSDASSYFVRLAEDIGLSSEGMESCLAERSMADVVQAAYDAGVELGIRGTPTVYVDGFKVGDYTRLENYLTLLDISEKFAQE
ncbi:MAG: DsbA family protein [Trueperaceae bacterium]|nr:DsbA family protein [Trueperaceae bacterium]